MPFTHLDADLTRLSALGRRRALNVNEIAIENLFRSLALEMAAR
jgi:hypothetical protein